MYIGETSRAVADRIRDHSWLARRRPKINEERKSDERRLVIALQTPVNALGRQLYSMWNDLFAEDL